MLKVIAKLKVYAHGHLLGSGSYAFKNKTKQTLITSMQNTEILNKNWMFAGFPCSDPGESPICADYLEILSIYSSSGINGHSSSPAPNRSCCCFSLNSLQKNVFTFFYDQMLQWLQVPPSRDNLLICSSPINGKKQRSKLLLPFYCQGLSPTCYVQDFVES